MTDNEETILTYLKRGPKTTRQIADSTIFTAEQMSSQLKRMEKKGLVENITPQKHEATWRPLIQHDE